MSDWFSLLITLASPIGARESSGLALRQLFQEPEELRERDRGGLCTVDDVFACRTESGNGEGHRNPVIASRVDLRSVKALVPRNRQAILELNELRTHCLQVLRYKRDSVGLLYAKLFRIANLDSIVRVWSDRSEH